MNIPSLKNVIKKHQISAKKNLGQNFLLDENIFNIIHENLTDIKNQNLIEIGPGIGSLTRIILEYDYKSLFLIEKDQRFIDILSELKNYYNKDFNIINQDALIINERSLINDKFSIISNLPYNISTKLLFKWLALSDQVNFMFLMFQQEVANRIIAKPNSKAYGKLSILTQLICDVSKICTVEPESFVPAPKVHSSFLRFKVLSKPLYNHDSDNLKKILDIVFMSRRKMLRKSLKSFATNLDTLIENTTISLDQRPEEISIKDYCQMSLNLKTTNI